MITTADLVRELDDSAAKAACPLPPNCSSLGRPSALLDLRSGYYTRSGLPVFLVQDENQRMKEDEVKGELRVQREEDSARSAEQKKRSSIAIRLFGREYRMSLRASGPCGWLFHGEAEFVPR